jgi:hypothetical protein
VATPTPAGTLTGDFNELYDVVCPSPASCWADGQYGTESSTGETSLNQVLHWNGRAWSLVSVPQPAGSGPTSVQGIDAIRCASVRSCVAIGAWGSYTTYILHNLALRWNGRKWSMLTVPNPGHTSAKGDLNILDGLGCTGPGNCWAVGEYGSLVTEVYRNEILHWNGRQWSVTKAPDPDTTGPENENELWSVSCLDAASCWAVGYDGNLDVGTKAILSEALHWNGTKWSLVPTPDPAGSASGDLNELYGIRCASASQCWAVGYGAKSGGSDLGQALRWTGSTWRNG